MGELKSGLSVAKVDTRSSQLENIHGDSDSYLANSSCSTAVVILFNSILLIPVPTAKASKRVSQKGRNEKGMKKFKKIIEKN